MTRDRLDNLPDASGWAQLVLPCSDLDAALAFYTDRLGFQLDMIMPADAPRVAVLSGYGITLRLETQPSSVSRGQTTLRIERDHTPTSAPAPDIIDGPDNVRIMLVDRRQPASVLPTIDQPLVSRAGSAEAWVQGRAGMQYRDLVPGRLDGGLIASQIRIHDGGLVPDYVHFHEVGFQMIYCRRGWVRVVYEDQGPPFVMHPGDCVLQPPTIRHRVLESSPGLEVIEVGSPAEHETRRDHMLQLPTPQVRPERLFGGQRFVRHVAADAGWEALVGGFSACQTGIGAATQGTADVRILRCGPSGGRLDLAAGRLRLLLVLEGRMRLSAAADYVEGIAQDDSCVAPTACDSIIQSTQGCELLEVSLALR